MPPPSAMSPEVRPAGPVAAPVAAVAAALAAALAAIGLLGGCGQTGRTDATGTTDAGPAAAASGPAAAASVPGPENEAIAATVSQFREDEVLGQVRVRLTSASAARVATLRLDWAGLPGLPDTVPDYPLAPGVPVDLPVPLAPAACGEPPMADAVAPPTHPAAVTAVLGIEGPGDEVTQVRVPVAGAGPTLSRVFERACRQQALADRVSVAFERAWTPTVAAGLPALATTLAVRRGSAPGPIDVVALDGSVLLALRPAGRDTLPARLPGGTDAMEVPVTVTTTGRCDGHALGESKQTYAFDVTVDVDGPAGPAEGQPVSVTVPDEQRPAVWEVMVRACSVLAHRSSGTGG